jgi:hypothetical protein
MTRTILNPSTILAGVDLYQDAKGMIYVPSHEWPELARLGWVKRDETDATGETSLILVPTGGGNGRHWAKCLALVTGTDGADYVREDLQAAFEEIRDRDNWKNPISAELDADAIPDGYADTNWGVYDQACRFYTGGELKIANVYRDQNGNVRTVRVVSEGYYHHIGA